MNTGSLQKELEEIRRAVTPLLHAAAHNNNNWDVTTRICCYLSTTFSLISLNNKLFITQQ
jgi:hypothetical protein